MKPKIGIQLWSIQEECQKDFLNALTQVKTFGYEGVEFAGYYGHSAEEVKEILQKNQLEVAGSHVPYEKLRDQLEETLAFEETIGNKRIVIPYANFKTFEEWQEFIQQLKVIERAVAERGQRLYYHNHAHEFTSIANKDLLDYISKQVPGILLEVDLYWLAFAGKEVSSWVNEHKEVIGLFHIKDQQEEPVESTDLGLGILPLQDYVKEGIKMKLPWLIVEQEAFQKRTPIEAAAFNAQVLHELIKS